MTGAAGRVGRRLIGRLVDDPDVVRLVALDVGPVPDPPHGIEAHVADVTVTDLVPLLSGIDTLVHLASVAGADAADDASERVVLDGTRRVLAAASEAGVSHIVAVTGAVVYGAWPNNPVPLTEEAPLRPNPGFGLAVQLAQVERVLADWADDHPGTTVAVLRPAPVVDGDGPGWLARALRAGVGLLGDDEPPAQFLHVDDLVGAIDVARSAGLDGPLNAAPDGWVDAETLRSLEGVASRLRLPDRVARQVASWGWQLGEGAVPAGLVPYTRQPWVIANDRLRAAGWVPAYTNEEAFVVSHEGTWWQHVSPRRRQELALGAAGALLLASTVGVAWLARRARRRSAG